jgi:hypothetical protein
MIQPTEPTFDGILSGVAAGLVGPGVALNMQLTSESGECRTFTVRLFPEDARRLSSILAEAASAAGMGEAATCKRQ